ncbi:MAG: hypothetical protein JSU97_02940 [Dehalococcoidia bacterium]|nr:MAG: hypothetical protein JSU97_02940 [Dehalococcoidia bacterium]
MTEASEQALKILRDESLFQWYLIPLLAFVVYVYAVEVERRNWSAVFAGLAFYGMDLFNETWNALVLHFTDRSAVWTTPGDTAYLIFVGLTIEISAMFAIAGVAFTKMLPADKRLRILGIPNRWLFAVVNAILCVFVEVLLNRADVLVWEYPWWNFPNIGLIVLLGYLPFMAVSFWVYDMEKIRDKIATVLVIYAVDLTAIILFAGLLGWI